MEKNIFERLDYYDHRGIRIFTGYAANGLFSLTIYRRKSEDEKKKNPPRAWSMVRHGHIQSYRTRKLALEKGFEIAEDLLKIHSHLTFQESWDEILNEINETT